MSGQLGELVISLQADIARFTSDMGKAAKISQDSAKQITGGLQAIPDMFGKIGLAAAGITALLGGGKMFGSMISTTKDVTAEVVKLSKVFGISAEQASVMRVALDDALLTTDDAVAASDRLTRTSLKNAQAFKTAGIEIRDSNGNLKDSMTVMMEVNGFLKTLKEGKDRDSAAMALYGKGWREISGILRLTSDGMKEAEERAKKLHLIFGQDGIAEVKAYKLAMKDLDDVAESFKVTIGREMIKVLTDLAVAFGDVGADSADTFSKGLRQKLRDLKDFRAGVDQIARDIAIRADGGSFGERWITAGGRKEMQAELLASQQMYDWQMQRNAERFGTAVKPVGRPTGKPDGRTPDFAKEANEQKDAYVSAWNSMQSKIKELNPFLGEHEKALQKMNDEYDSLIGKFPEHSAELEKNRIVYKGWLDTTKEMKDAVSATSSEFKALFAQWDETPAAPEFRNFFTDEEITQAHDQMNSVRSSTFANRALKEEIAGNTPETQLKFQYDKEVAETEAYIQEMIDLEQTHTEAYKQEVEKRTLIDEKYAADKKKLDAQNFRDGMTSIGNSMNALGSILMQGNKKQFEAGKKMAIASATISMIEGAMNAFAAGSKTHPALGVAAAAFAMAAGGARIAQISATNFEARAMGGPVGAGQSYLVGEQGPELIRMGNVGGNVTPNHKLGGQEVNVTPVFQISTGVSETVQSEIMRLAPMLTQMSVSAVQQAINSGGSMSMAVGRM